MVQFDENPFDLQKASNYSSQEILGHWVDLAGQHGGLVSVLKPTSITPMILFGGKGSGKTHLMRYCSAPVQAARHSNNMADAIKKEKYLGVYVTAEALNTPRFTGKGYDEEFWSTVFSMYFELWLVLSLLGVLRDAVGSDFIKKFEKDEAKKLSSLFDVDLEISSMEDVYLFLYDLRRRVDYSVNNSAFTRKIEDFDIPFSNGRLVFGIPDLIAEMFPELGSPVFVYLIDELENFTESQQLYLNTLIRYRKGKATIKVGTRLYGMKTFSTLGSGEKIKAGSEFERVELDSFLREHEDEYNGFAVDLIINRLKTWSNREVDQDGLGAAFEQLDTTNHFQKTTLDLMRSYDRQDRERPHVKNFGRKLRDVGLADGLVDALLANLKCTEFPLLEKANFFIFARSWDGEADTVEPLSNDIRNDCVAIQGGARNSSYSQILSHFSSDLLAQMYREARQPLPYAGLSTFIELSEGIPRNLLGTLSLIYRRAQFAGERPFAGGTISVQSQTRGVLDGAKFFWDDAQPETEAADVRDSIDALALLFRSIRFADAPSECDLCTFSVNLEKLTEKSRAMIRVAENWSHLIKIPSGSRNKNTRSIDAKFQLAPMLAPLWEVSHHRRGTIELQSDLANAIFDPSCREDLLRLVQLRIAGMNSPKIWKRESVQRSLI